LGYDTFFAGGGYFNAKEVRMNRPNIGITMRIETGTDRFYLSRHYSEAVAAAGGAPVHIGLIPDESYVESVVANLDGLLLPGSDSDVDPLLYGQQPHPGLGSVHPLKDQTDLLAIAAAERRNIPIFAICFGMQVLNVARGGTLIQDISSQKPDAIKHQQGTPRDRPSHHVELLEGSLVEALCDGPKAAVNSHHHQAVDLVGDNLLASAWSSDGIIEALEDPRADRFVVAVQWHPELGWEYDSFSKKLFERFVKEACVKAGEQKTLASVASD
jgi:putative glutamine amidotransferase